MTEHLVKESIRARLGPGPAPAALLTGGSSDPSDSSHEHVFDNLAQLAASSCGTPIALITFVDETRHWFTCQIGVNISKASLEEDLCPLVANVAQPLIIRDARTDPQYSHNPIVVAEPCIRFCAGVPLVTAEGESIGTLCVLDRVPRELTEAQWTSVQMVASEVTARIELRMAQRALVREREESARLLALAQQEHERRVQSEQQRAYVMSSARCLLWYADITEIGMPDHLHWDAGFVTTDLAHGFLPLEMLPGESYQSARYRARLPEDRAACDRLGTASIRAGKSYEQEFRCRTRDGTIHWLREDIHVETVVPGRKWRAVGVCTDITDAKRAAEKERFLSDSSAELASSLDYEVTLATVARLAVPNIADWCVVHILEADGNIRQLAVAHADPDKVSWAEEFEERYPCRPGAMAGAAEVMRTGRSELYESVTDEMLVASAVDDEHLRRMRDVRTTSVMMVPMAARGKILGAITFVSAESGHRYKPSDLAIAEDLAYSAALAVDNARSYRAAQQEIDRREQTERRLRLHQQEIETLNERLRASVEVTHHHVRNNLQIISALAQLPIEDGTETVPVSALTRIGHHTSSLAAVHDLLMQRTNIDTGAGSLSARNALERLLPLLEAKCQGRSLRLRGGDVVLTVQEIGSLCLLVNELVINAIQHGRGAIGVSLTVHEGIARLEVSDAGPGFSSDFDWRTIASTGLCLIENAARHDLRGTVRYENRDGGGARVVVEFPTAHSS